MTQLVENPSRRRDWVQRDDEMPLAQAPAAGHHQLGYVLLILVNATLFIRPGEIFPATENWPIYWWLILACLLVSLPPVFKLLRWQTLRHNPGVVCVLGLLAAVFLSHASHGDLWSARYGAIDFSKIVIYFVLLVALVDTLPRLRHFLALTTIFIAITALFAVLKYHGVIQMEAMQVLERNDAMIDPKTGEAVVVQQLQASGIFSDPNDFSSILVSAILAAWYFVLEAGNWMKRAAWLALLPLLVYAFALTRSRGGFLALVAGVGAFMLTQWGWRKALMIGAILFPLLTVAFAGRQTNIDLSNKEDTAVGRVLLWRDGLVLFKYSPIFGNGYNTYAEEVGQVAHNSYVHGFAELGFFGGSLFLAAILVPLASLRKLAFPAETVQGVNARRLCMCVLAMVLAYGVSIFSLTRNYSNATYLIVGLGCSLCAMALPASDPWRLVDFRFLRRAAIAGVLMIVFVDVFIRVFA